MVDLKRYQHSYHQRSQTTKVKLIYIYIYTYITYSHIVLSYLIPKILTVCNHTHQSQPMKDWQWIYLFSNTTRQVHLGRSWWAPKKHVEYELDGFKIKRTCGNFPFLGHHKRSTVGQWCRNSDSRFAGRIPYLLWSWIHILMHKAGCLAVESWLLLGNFIFWKLKRLKPQFLLFQSKLFPGRICWI